MPGIFFSLDGVDGAGKSTQCRLLAEWLRAQGREVVCCRDPGGTAVGDCVRAILLDRGNSMSVVCEAFLYMASRAQLVEEVIRPTLDAGRIVVADRFVLANVVYQGHAGGMSVETLWQLGRISAGGRLPDRTIVLDLPAANAAGRKETPPDRLESRGPHYLEKVRQGFLVEAARDPLHVRVVDASRPVEDVQEMIRRELADVLG